MSQNAVEIYNQGFYYYTGSNGYPVNPGRALDYFTKAAELGVSDAMNYLGIIYEAGEIVSQNYRMAADWFYKAIQTDTQNANALYNLGRLYYAGAGVGKDMEKAYRLFLSARDSGFGDANAAYPRCCHFTGCILIEHFKNYKEAYPYFVEAAKYGNIPEAWYNLGWLTEKGAVPVKDPGSDPFAAKIGLALGFYEKAANLDYAPAMDAAGRICYACGMRDQAFEWLEKAVSMGNEMAKKRLKMIKVAQGGSLWNLLG